MNINTLLTDILHDEDKMLIAAILLILWREKASRELMLALVYILFA